MQVIGSLTQFIWANLGMMWMIVITVVIQLPLTTEECTTKTVKRLPSNNKIVGSEMTPLRKDER